MVHFLNIFKGKSVALIVTFVPRMWFTEWKDGKVKKRGQDYEAVKMKIGAQMWKQVEELLPQLDGKVRSAV